MPPVAAPRPFPSGVPRVEESGQLRVQPGKVPLSPLQEFSPEKQQIFPSPCQEFRVKSSKVQKGTDKQEPPR